MEREPVIDPVPGARATVYVICIVILCVTAAIGVVAITVARPETDNSTLIATLLGIFTPVVAALMAGALQQVHLAVNSRLSQLLAITSSASRAEGQLDGQASPTLHKIEANTAETAEGVKALKP